MTLINIGSAEPGSWSPFPHANLNIATHQGSLYVYHSSDLSSAIGGFTSISEALNSVTMHRLTTPRIAHVVYEPGRSYPTIDPRLFTTLIVRLGDLHHLSNPLTSSLNFLANYPTATVFFNTTPHWVPLFQALGIQARFWHDLSESGRFSHADLSYNHGLKKQLPIHAAYLGPAVSYAHPRRSYFVNQIAYSFPSISLYPPENHYTWFSHLKECHYVVAPSLNSQISHNIYTPAFLGCVILTDFIARPSFLSIPDFPVIEFDSPQAMSDFLSQDTHTLKNCWNSYFPVEHPSFIRDACALEGNMGFCRYEYSGYSKLPTLKLQIPDLISLGLSPLLLANIFEVLQELHRITIDPIYLFVSPGHFPLFNQLLTLPRIYILSVDQDCRNQVGVSFFPSTTTSNITLKWLNASEIDSISSRIVDLSPFAFFDSSTLYNVWPQRLHSALSIEFK